MYHQPTYNTIFFIYKQQFCCMIWIHPTCRFAHNQSIRTRNGYPSACIASQRSGRWRGEPASSPQYALCGYTALCQRFEAYSLLCPWMAWHVVWMGNLEQAAQRCSSLMYLIILIGCSGCYWIIFASPSTALPSTFLDLVDHSLIYHVTGPWGSFSHQYESRVADDVLVLPCSPHDFYVLFFLFLITCYYGIAFQRRGTTPSVHVEIRVPRLLLRVERRKGSTSCIHRPRLGGHGGNACTYNTTLLCLVYLGSLWSVMVAFLWRSWETFGPCSSCSMK